jgi:hypothetical protein
LAVGIFLDPSLYYTYNLAISSKTMQKAKNPPATISVPAAARRAGVGTRLLKDCIESGLIPAIQMGSRWRVLVVPFDHILQTLAAEGDKEGDSAE